MKYAPLVIMLLVFATNTEAQRIVADSVCARIDTRPDDTLKVAAYLQLAQPYLAQNHDIANAILARALVLAERLKFIPGVARALTGMSLASSYAGNHQAAYQHAQHAYEISKALPVARMKALALNAMGVALNIARREDEALKFLREGRIVARSISDPRIEMNLLTNQGSANFQLGRMDEAIECWEYALRISESVNDDGLIAASCMNLGNAQTTPERKLLYYRRSLHLQMKAGNRYFIAQTLSQIGQTLKSIGLLDEALDTLKIAYNISHDLQNKFLLANAALNLGNVFMFRNESKMALEMYYEALDHAESIKDRAVIASCLVNLTKLFQCGKDSELGNHDALEYGKKAVAVAEALQHRDVLNHAYTFISGVYQCRGDFEKALQCFQIASMHRDSLYSEKNLAKINELTMRYEADMRARALCELEDRQRMQLLEIERRTLEAQESANLARLLEKQNAMKDLELKANARLLALNKAESDARRKQLAFVKTDRALKASIADRASWQRNSMVGILLLLAILAFLGYRHGNTRRQAERLRAEVAESAACAAEYKAAAAEHLAQAAQAQIDLAEKEAQRTLAWQVMQLQEQERNRIAADLHDSLGHGLLVIKNSSFIARRDPGLSESLQEQLTLITNTATSVLHDIRKISHNLRPVHLDRTGLSEALRSSLQALGDSTGVAFGGEIDEIDGLFDRSAEMNVFRIIQEGANNIIRHAAASEATLRVVRVDDSLEISIEDNGRGFDADVHQSFGFGLTGMQDRVRLLRGRMDVQSSPGCGTCIFIQLPVPPADNGVSAAHLGKSVECEA